MSRTKIGKYDNLTELGHGGMAQVYLGIDPTLHRKVAIKVIQPHLAKQEDFAARFQREAKTIAALRHPNIIQVFEYAIDDGLPYMVMEYLEGGDLEDLLAEYESQGKKMPVGQIANILDKVASGLDYAHERGLIHRDIKPSNILFTEEGEPIIADFGIVKLMDEESVLTHTGGLVGSPRYLPPEQASEQPVDKRSDIYSLGIVVYQMATGQVPFEGDIINIMMKHVTQAPENPADLNPVLTNDTALTILKAIAKDPEDRYHSVGEMAQAFRNSLEAQTQRAPDRPKSAPPDEAGTLPEIATPVPSKLHPRTASTPPSPERPESPPPPLPVAAETLRRDRHESGPMDSAPSPSGPPSSGQLPVPPAETQKKKLPIGAIAGGLGLLGCIGIYALWSTFSDGLNLPAFISPAQNTPTATHTLAPTHTSQPATDTPAPAPDLTATPAFGLVVDWDTAASGDVLYHTDFDAPAEQTLWIEFPVPSNKLSWDGQLEDGVYSMVVNNNYATMYSTFDGVYYENGQDVIIETGFDNVGPVRNNNISLYCRATNKGWYEFSFTSSGLWYIYKYLGSNEYRILANGGVSNYDKDDTDHVIRAECIGDQLSFYYDGELLRNGTIRDSEYKEGQVGLSLYAHDLIGVVVEFDYFTIIKP